MVVDAIHCPSHLLQPKQGYGPCKLGALAALLTSQYGCRAYMCHQHVPLHYKLISGIMTYSNHNQLQTTAQHNR